MLFNSCPLKHHEQDEKTSCDANCAWLLPDVEGKPKHCAITWIPRLVVAIEAQTKLMKDLMAAGFPAFPPEGH